MSRPVRFLFFSLGFLAALLPAARAADKKAAAEAAKLTAGSAVKDAALAAPAAKKRKIRNLPGEEVSLQTRDGWTLTANYRPAEPERPTLLLLHDVGARRQDWHPLAAAALKRGFGFLAVDFRGHGQSQNAPEGQPAQWNKFSTSKGNNEWENMREDLVAALAFLEGKVVAPEDVVLGGADVGSSLALKYAAVHKEIPLVFLLSAGLSYRDVLTVNAMRQFKGRPLLFVVADDDRASGLSTGLLSSIARQNLGEENVTILKVPIRHGTKILAADKEISGKILDWVDEPVRVLDEVAVSSDAAEPEAQSPLDKPSEPDLPAEDELDSLYGKEKKKPADDLE
ncbi:MAG: alpha/beta fold hydrolase [Elusimicrobiota bacterium]|mgnify:CR=1 FL=1